MIDGKHMEVASPVFVRQFASRLRAERRRARRPLFWLASRSAGRFTTNELRDAEAGMLPLDAARVGDLAGLYRIDLATVLPATRRGLTIRPGLLTAGGVTVPFDPDDAGSLVAAYFRLTRTLRALDDDAPLQLRRSDVVAIAGYLDEHSTPTDAGLQHALTHVLAVAEGDRVVMVASLRAGAASIGLVDEARRATVR
ncbi:MAG: hypothetical protein WD023_04030 [Ilumatobacteraceae bacterium]